LHLFRLPLHSHGIDKQTSSHPTPLFPSFSLPSVHDRQEFVEDLILDQEAGELFSAGKDGCVVHSLVSDDFATIRILKRLELHRQLSMTTKLFRPTRSQLFVAGYSASQWRLMDLTNNQIVREMKIMGFQITKVVFVCL
jgi:hypothetical protein